MLIKRHMLEFIKGTYSLIDEKFDFCFNDRVIWGTRNESRDAVLVYNDRAEPGKSYRFAHKAPFVAGMELKVNENMEAVLTSPAFRSVGLPLEEAPGSMPEYMDFEKSEFTELENFILRLGGKITASNSVIAASPGKNMIYAAPAQSHLGFTAEIPPKADKFNLGKYGLELEFTAVDHVLRKKVITEHISYGVNELQGVQEVFPDATSLKEAISIIPQIGMERITLKAGDDQLEMHTSYGKLGVGLMLREKAEIGEIQVSREGLLSFLGFVVRTIGVEGFPGSIMYNNMGDGYFATKMEAGYSVYAF